MCLVTFWTEHWTFYTIKKHCVRKVAKTAFFYRGQSMLSVGIFPSFLFRQKEAWQKCLETLHRKLALLHYKNSNLRKSQNLHFFKGASPCFQSKTETFYILSFQAKKRLRIKIEVFRDVLHRKVALLVYKNTKGVSPCFQQKN